MIFHDRTEAGRFLAAKLAHYAGQPNVIVLALPRGGVPVAFEVAKFLGAPLDVFLVRKLGVPGHEEAAMGAIASGGILVLNDNLVRQLEIPEDVVGETMNRERQELKRREYLYRRGLPEIDVAGLVVILVDDGLATGSTMRQPPRHCDSRIPNASLSLFRLGLRRPATNSVPRWMKLSAR